MKRASFPLALIVGLSLGGCASHRLAASHPARGGLASAPIETPTKIEYPAGGDGVIARSGPVIIAGQPTEESLRRLIRDEGITVVINLRSPKEMEDPKAVPFDEVAVLRELGVDYVHVPVSRPENAPTPEKVDQVAEALARHEGKVLLHCASAGRASHMWAAYLVRHRGVSPEKAVADAALIQPNRPYYADFLGADVVMVPR